MRARALSVLALASVAFFSPTSSYADATGPYAGASLSWTTLPTDSVETEFLLPPAPPQEEDGTFDPDGLGGTLLIGYRTSLGSKLRAGLEFDSTFFSLDEIYDGYDYQSDWLLTLRGVLGLEVTENLFVFGTFGAAWLDVSASEDGVQVAEDTLTGWVVGVGAEHLMCKIGGHDVAVRGDYLYADFESFSYETAGPFIPPVVSEFIENDTELHQIRLGLVVRPN